MNYFLNKNRKYVFWQWFSCANNANDRKIFDIFLKLLSLCNKKVSLHTDLSKVTQKRKTFVFYFIEQK